LATEAPANNITPRTRNISSPNFQAEFDYLTAPDILADAPVITR
jgi:hypothetical protein